MALSAGTAFIDVKPKLTKGFGGAIGGKLKSALGSAGAIAATGGLAIGAAVAVGVVKSIASFAELEQGMNEVFTLLPGISEDAMDELTGQVKDFSKEFGVLPEETVPALYQAISAGVPKDNVFDFLETAQKAALGGVTNLETAVDGISSVVNAYGSDVIDAGEASDLMFTAVRLGKTNFEELSASLFNVIPTASALGIGFEDVTAGLAAMTAQGVPTSVATTQLRSLFVELGKEGTKVGDIFEEAAGQSFPDFIASGGNVEGALAILKDASDDTGVALSDMFGSVEAGSAALSLTGSDAFSDALGEMADSAGATDTAFEQMDQGIGRSFQKIKVVISVALADIGEKIAPFVAMAVEWLGEVLPKAIEFLLGIVDKLKPVFEAVFTFIGGIFGSFGEEAEEGAETAGGAFGSVGDLFTTIGEVISTAVEVVMVVLDILRAFWDDWGETIIAILSSAFDTIVKVLTAAFDIIKGIFDIVIGILTGDWSRAWEGIKSIVSGVINAIKAIISNIFNQIVAIAAGIMRNFGDKIRSGIDRVLTFFRELPGKIFGFLTGLPGMFFDLAGDLIAGLINGLGNIASLVGDKIKSGISSAISAVGSFFGIGSPSLVMAAVIGAPLSEGIALGVGQAAGGVTDKLTDVVTGAQLSAMAAIDTADLDLLRFGTTGDVMGALARSAPTAPAAAASTRARDAVGAAGAGTHIELHEGAVQIFNPEPELASTEIPRTMRRIERRFNRG